jgi:hypothetical protein
MKSPETGGKTYLKIPGVRPALVTAAGIVGVAGIACGNNDQPQVDLPPSVREGIQVREMATSMVYSETLDRLEQQAQEIGPFFINIGGEKGTSFELNDGNRIESTDRRALIFPERLEKYPFGKDITFYDDPDKLVVFTAGGPFKIDVQDINLPDGTKMDNGEVTQTIIDRVVLAILREGRSKNSNSGLSWQGNNLSIEIDGQSHIAGKSFVIENGSYDAEAIPGVVQRSRDLVQKDRLKKDDAAAQARDDAQEELDKARELQQKLFPEQ